MANSPFSQLSELCFPVPKRFSLAHLQAPPLQSLDAGKRRKSLYNPDLQLWWHWDGPELEIIPLHHLLILKNSREGSRFGQEKGSKRVGRGRCLTKNMCCQYRVISPGCLQPFFLNICGQGRVSLVMPGYCVLPEQHWWWGKPLSWRHAWLGAQ